MTAIDDTLIGRGFAPTAPHEVTAAGVDRFARSVGVAGSAAVPPTYPIVLAFDAMLTFLEAEGLALERIVHGEQRFAYERPVVVGDVLTAALEVTGLRRVAGNDIIATTSRVTAADGSLVCTTSATLVHRGEQ